MIPSDNHNETTQDESYQESEPKSISESGISQHEVSTDNEQKGFDFSNKTVINEKTRSQDDDATNIEEDSTEKVDEEGASEEEEDDGNMTEKEEENTEESENEDSKESECAEENQVVDVVDMDELKYDDEASGKRITPNITNRLKKRKDKSILTKCQSFKAAKKRKVVGPTKGWSKVSITVNKKKSLKRKEVHDSDSDYEVEQDVLDILPLAKKRTDGDKNVSANIPKTPIDNISFHHVSSVEKWKFICQRRLALERELGKDALECKKIMDLIDEARLKKSVTIFRSCYEKLVKKFIVNIAEDCDNSLSKEFRKIFVRGCCVEFSPEVINKFLGRNEGIYTDLKVTDD